MSRRIFLVEDNLLIRQTLTEMLEDVADAEVVAWADGEEQAVERMQASTWDVALVDLFLQTGSGLGVARAFADRRADQRLYVVSNYATQDMRERCHLIGVDDVFDKSTELERLIDTLLNDHAPRH